MAKLVGIVLVVLGVAALVYKGFNLPAEKHGVRIGTVELAVEKSERVSVPTWMGVVAIGAGAALLLAARKS